MARAEAKVTQAQQHLKSVQDNLNQVKDEVINYFCFLMTKSMFKVINDIVFRVVVLF